MSKMDQYEQMTLDELQNFLESIDHSLLTGASSLSFWGNVRKDVVLAIQIKRGLVIIIEDEPIKELHHV